MNKVKYLLFLPILMYLAGCMKNEVTSTAFSFNSGSTVLSGNNYSATYQVDTSTGMHNFNGVFYVSNTNNSSYINIAFSSVNYIVPGTYALNNTYPNSTSGTLNYEANSINYEGTTGSFQITQIDTVNHKISGKFQFNGVNPADTFNTAAIANGIFTNISFMPQ